MTTNELYTIIKNSNIISEFNLNENSLFNLIIQYNTEFTIYDTPNEIIRNCNITQRIFDKAKNSNFYIGLNRTNGTLAIDWIYIIKQKLQSSI